MRDETAAHGFLRRPEPRAIGWASRGAEIAAGRLRLEGAVVEAAAFPDGLPEAASAELHGFGWLDDLAALGTPAARNVAQGAVLDWVRRHPDPGAGPVWRADVTGRRVMRWVFHAGTLLPGLDRAASTPIFASLHAQLGHLERRLSDPEAGLEAAAGLAIAAMSLRGAEAHLAPALGALAETADRLPADDPRRNPEALLETAALLAWVIDAAAEARVTLPPSLRQALGRMAPVLRALRHADGGLPRMHGGGAGAPGRLDEVLRAAGPARPIEGGAMGFARLARGRSTVILDAAPPPPEGDASTLGLEFTVARHPLIVGCGSGRRFGGAWATAGRATPAHSSLVLDGLSSARLGAGGQLDLASRRMRVQGTAAEDDSLAALQRASHDGWRESHGFEHVRALRLAPDGLGLHGEDALEPVGTGQHRAREATLHFHLHPEVASGLSRDGVALRLPSGEHWRFGHEGGSLTLEPSAWLDPALPAPRPTRQIVLRAPVTPGARWKLAWHFTRV